MEEKEIKIYSTGKDENNLVTKKLIFEGQAQCAAGYRVKEILGGVENGTFVSVVIRKRLRTKPSCGDLCVIDGKEYTVYEISEMSENSFTAAFKGFFMRVR